MIVATGEFNQNVTQGIAWNWDIDGTVKLVLDWNLMTVAVPMAMSNQPITGLSLIPSANTDATSKYYVDQRYGVQDYEIPTEHESSEWDFENYITNSKNGFQVGQAGRGIATDVNWYVPVYVGKGVTVRELGYNNIAKTTGSMSVSMALFSNRSGSSSTTNVSGDGQNYPYKRLLSVNGSGVTGSNEAKIFNVFQTITAGLYWICLNITYTQVSNALPYVYAHNFDSANVAGYFRDAGNFASDFISPICCFYDSASSIPSTAQDDMTPDIGNGPPALFIKCT